MKNRMKMPKINQSETEVKKAITEYLEWHGWEVYPIGNKGGFRGYNKKGEIRFSFAGKKGVLDLYCVKKGCLPMWVETKATGKKPSKEQEDFMRLVNSTPRGIAFWCDSLERFKAFYSDILIEYGLQKSVKNTNKVLEEVGLGVGDKDCPDCKVYIGCNKHYIKNGARHDRLKAP